MRTAELLKAVASWLENPNNEIMLLAEDDDKALMAAAKVCHEAAKVIRAGAPEVDALEPADKLSLNSEDLDSLKEFVTALDCSGDKELQKKASVIDELMLTLAASAEDYNRLRAHSDMEIQTIKDKYLAPGIILATENHIPEMNVAVEKSPYLKEYMVMEAPLSSRYCPDHAGVPLARVPDSDNTYQCTLDGKVYDFKNGYTNQRGEKVPGGDVANQTHMGEPLVHSLFDTRETRLVR